MPCHNDNPKPNNAYNQQTAKNLAYVLHQLKRKIPDPLKRAANNAFCYADYTAELCELLKSFSDSLQEDIIYNAYIKESRQLADWWENHLEMDARREALEKKASAKEALKAEAIKKLTIDERWALGIDNEQ